MLKITASQIEKWTDENAKKAQALLPELIRRLIAGKLTVKNLYLPSGDSTYLPWEDGRVFVLETNPYLDLGDNCIEIWTDKDIGSKAQRDYKKRGETELGRTAEVNFVFCTSRRFSNPIAWERKKEAEKIWKTVHLIDATKLESWLDECLPARAWFSSVIWMPVHWAASVELAWESLSSSTSPWISPQIFLNWRQDSQGLLDKELVSGGGKKISVISDSPLEAQGFILSHLLQNDFARKAILVKDLDAWEAIISSGEEGLIIVLDHSFMPASVGLAVNKGHLLLVPSPKTGLPIKFDASIELGRMSWESRESALSEIVPKDMAAQIMADTKGYFLPVLRHKALNGNLVLPAPWSTEDPVALLILLFIPAWEEKTANRLPWHDTELIAEVSGISYEDFQEILERLSRSVDAPVRLVGNVWQLISKTDYWAFVEWHLGRTKHQIIRKILLAIISDSKIDEEVPPEWEWTLAFSAPHTLYSATLKQWVADSIALLAEVGSIELKKYLQESIWEALDSCWKSPGETLNMIGSALPALAETAPKQVLNFVNNHLSRLDVLFTKTGSFPFSSWPHTNLLWALELISLEPELFEESVEVLLVLEKNYGSTIAQNYSNSPINSLVNLFLPWKSNAHVEVTEKMQILRRMSRSYPDMAYRLVGRILTTHTSIPPMQPRYRQNPTEKSVTWEQYFSSCNELTAIFVNLMAGREDLWEIITILNALQGESKARFMDLIAEKKDEIWAHVSEESAEKIMQSISYYLQRTEEEGEEIIRSQVLEIYNKLRCGFPLAYNKWVFSVQPCYLPEKAKLYSKEPQFEEYNSIAAVRRAEISAQLMEDGGWQAVKELAWKLQNPYLLAESLGNRGEELFEYAYSSLSDPDERMLPFYLSLIDRITHKTSHFAEKKKSEIVKEEDSVIIGRFLRIFGFSHENLNLVRLQSNEAQQAFWESLKWTNNGLQLIEDEDETDYIVSTLVERNMLAKAGWQIFKLCHEDTLARLRPWTIVHFLEYLPQNWDWAEMQEVRGFLSDLLQKLFPFLYNATAEGKVTKEEVVWLEMTYLQVFEQPTLIYEELTWDPAIFQWLINTCYRPNDWKEAGIEETWESSAYWKTRAASLILRNFQRIPWMREDGTLDYLQLKSYITSALTLTRESKRWEIGAEKLWELLSHAPMWLDGIWPKEEIRDLLEEIHSEDLERGMEVGKQNSRGITVRDPFAWGVLERELARSYSDASGKLKSSKWPRTARLLRRMSDRYEIDAKREDERAELDRWL